MENESPPTTQNIPELLNSSGCPGTQTNFLPNEIGDKWATNDWNTSFQFQHVEVDKRKNESYKQTTFLDGAIWYDLTPQYNLPKTRWSEEGGAD